jgi:hypothetical protein
MIKGIGNRSFLAGQWVAEMFSVAMSTYDFNPITEINESWVEFMNFWSSQEGLDCFGGKGYIGSSNCTSVKRPTYYHYNFLASHFQGLYKSGDVSSISSNMIKSFGAKSDCGISVMIMNQDITNSRDVKVWLNDNTGHFATDVRVNIAFGLDKSYPVTIEPQTTIVLLYDICGNPQTMIKYKIDDALNDRAPVQTPIGNVFCFKNNCSPIELSRQNAGTQANNDNKNLIEPNDGTQGQKNNDIENLILANQGRQGIIGNVPNPATEQTAIYFNLGNTSATGEIVTTNMYGVIIARNNVTGNANKVDVDCSKFVNGLYFNSLIVEGNLVGSKKMVITK